MQAGRVGGRGDELGAAQVKVALARSFLRQAGSGPIRVRHLDHLRALGDRAAAALTGDRLVHTENLILMTMCRSTASADRRGQGCPALGWRIDHRNQRLCRAGGDSRRVRRPSDRDNRPAVWVLRPGRRHQLVTGSRNPWFVGMVRSDQSVNGTSGTTFRSSYRRTTRPVRAVWVPVRTARITNHYEMGRRGRHPYSTVPVISGRRRPG